MLTATKSENYQMLSCSEVFQFIQTKKQKSHLYNRINPIKLQQSKTYIYTDWHICLHETSVFEVLHTVLNLAQE